MDRYSTKLCVFDGVDFQYWKAKMEAYIQAQGSLLWKKVTTPFQVPDQVNDANRVNVENNSKARNLIIQGLGRSDFDRVVHHKSTFEVWKALCDYHEGSSTIKEVRQDMYKKDYMRFEMKPDESLDDFFACFNKILSNLRAVNVTFTDAENARQLLSALDMSIWEMKVTSIRESTVMSTLTLDVLYSKLKTHELDVLARKHGSMSTALTSQTNSSKSHDDNSSISYALSSLSAPTNEQLEQLPEDKLALLSTRVTKALQNVRSRKRGNSGPQRCFECGSLNHIRPKCPKFLARISRDEEKDEEETQSDKKKHTFRRHKKNGYLNQKVVHRVLSALEQVNLSDIDSESSDEDTSRKGKKIRELTGLCLMASSKSFSNSDLESDNEVEPSYDDLALAIEKLGTLLEKRTKKIKKHDALIESLYAEIDRLKTLIPIDDSCKSCDAIYAEFISLRDMHSSTLEELNVEKEKNENHVCVIDKPVSCDNCNVLELKLKDANATVDQLKHDLSTHEVCGRTA
jgi:hypothetical protein